MTTQELAYIQVEKLVKDFKSLPAPQLRVLNEMQTRHSYFPTLFRELGWNINNIVSQTLEFMDSLQLIHE
jgi:hypothetical protein